MATERLIDRRLKQVADMTSGLFEGEEWLENRRKVGELFEKIDLQVLEAVSQLPEFDSFSDEQKRAVLRLGLVMKDNVMSELLAGPYSTSRRKMEGQPNFALETAKKVGIEFTQDVIKATLATAEEAFGLKKSE